MRAAFAGCAQSDTSVIGACGLRPLPDAVGIHKWPFFAGLPEDHGSGWSHRRLGAVTKGVFEEHSFAGHTVQVRCIEERIDGRAE